MDHLQIIWLAIKKFRQAFKATTAIDINLSENLTEKEARSFIFCIQGMRLVVKNVTKEMQLAIIYTIKSSEDLIKDFTSEEAYLIFYGMGYIQGLYEEEYIEHDEIQILLKGLINLRFMASREPDYVNQNGEWSYSKENLKEYFMDSKGFAREEDFREIAFPPLIFNPN
ncbi:MAG: hypothetical protein JXA60_09305 [Candidatus Coatesbacteria bacterium]|nr:hypothetical protein [Candidatus Coatesbacteria bacterium]